VQNRHYPGLATKAESNPLLDFFFTRVLPQIQDMTELKVTMSLCYLLSKAENLYKPDKSGNYKREYPPFVTREELVSQAISMLGIDAEMVQQGLDLAAKRGSILRLSLNIDGMWQEACFANMEADREAINNLRRGPVCISKEGAKQALQPPSIFVLYEQNIGIITPMIAEELKEAEKLYPAEWIEEALKEAVTLNKRSWKYVARILERWASEGKDSGQYRQGVKKGGPDKYIKGKYGHLVKR